MTGINSDGEIVFWNIASNQFEYFQTEKYHDSYAISHDQKYLATGDQDKVIRLWDLKPKVLIKELKSHQKGVPFLEFSQDGKKLLSAGTRIRLWDINSGKIIHTYEGHSQGMVDLGFSDQDQKIYSSGSADTSIKLWDVKSGQLIDSFRMKDDDKVKSLEFHGLLSPDGKYMAWASAQSGKIHIWKLNDHWQGVDLYRYIEKQAKFR